MVRVSVITPTTDDRDIYLQRMQDNFFNQDYLNKEWIMIGDDHTMCWRYEGSNLVFAPWHRDCILTSRSIGAKRNKGVELATGDFIVHMDSDDIYAPDWISKCVQSLYEKRADIVGLTSCYFHKTDTNSIYDYVAPKGQMYFPEATLAYWRRVWERNPFPDTSAGEGRKFLANGGMLAPIDYKDGFLATIHGGNTHSHSSIPLMKKLPPMEAALILNRFYP